MQNIAENIFSRAGLLAFAQAIGFDDAPTILSSDERGVLEHLGRRGTLRALLVTTADCSSANTGKIARHLRNSFAAELQFYIFAARDYSVVRLATFTGEELATLTLEQGRVHAPDIDALHELVPSNGASGLQLSLQHARALDRVRVGNRFFEDFRAQRATVAEAWVGIAPRLSTERDQLALLLLSRLMFLYFLQRRGFLCGNRSFFLDALRSHFSTRKRYSFYRGALRPLFFGALNRRPEKRTRRAAALGQLPYLNGGLFERHFLERRFSDLDLPDNVARGVFENLLERYRFTATEGEREHAVDPEMLGRVFEGLMADSTRQSTGTFYTPANVVTRMVRAAFDAHLGQYAPHQANRILREVRVLDPACGSGAFLLGALAHIHDRRASVESARDDVLRHDIVARNLHGLDLQHDAALLCALRLWLSLIPDAASAEVQPLPNLDRRIRQGDALIDPFDLAADAAASPAVRAARRALQPLVLHYTTCDPEERPAVHRQITRYEQHLSRAWMTALRVRLQHQKRELKAEAASRDLFGATTSIAAAARSELCDVDTRIADLKRVYTKLRQNGAAPFFSFNVHFADAQRTGFDILLCNPPWVRSHNWPKHMTAAVKRRFLVCRDAGQVDLALVFLERAVSLLTPGGTLAIVLPAKFLRSASAGAARELMLEQMEIISIEDHSLDQRSIFGADAFAAIIVARKRPTPPVKDVAVEMVRRKASSLTFAVRQDRLRFDNTSPRSSWLLVPANVRAAMSRMSESSAPVASQLRTRRGIVTGNNGALIIRKVESKLGDLAVITSESGTEAVIEDCVLRPLVRGTDVDAWSFASNRHVIFNHDLSGRYVPPPRRVSRYLRDHTRADAQGRLGALQHAASSLDTVKLAWHDLAKTLKAVVLPANASCVGKQRTLVPLNTVYYISANPEDAYLLAAYFNSLPLRVFARAIAERAKDSHFRFFACTVDQLPLPANWRSFEATALHAISCCAHERRSIAADQQRHLDEVIAAAYGLSASGLNALRQFDEWLDGGTDDGH